MIRNSLAADANTPDYLPARMLNESVYCPRLFYYMWVDNVFVHNRETVEGSLRHSKIDARQDELIPADELDEEHKLHSRSVTLSGDTHGLIAKMDLIEVAEKTVTPVDYKRGKPRKNRDTDELEVWDTDQAQLGAQALVLRDNGYTCKEAVVYYVATKQRVRIAIDDALINETLQMLAAQEPRQHPKRFLHHLLTAPNAPVVRSSVFACPTKLGIAMQPMPKRTVTHLQRRVAGTSHVDSSPLATIYDRST